MENTKTLHITLKKKWFDMILSGEKKEEYREIKEYWINRLIHDSFLNVPVNKVPVIGLSTTVTVDRRNYHYLKGNSGFKSADCVNYLLENSASFNNYDTITFKNGYAAYAPEMVVELKGIEIKEGNPEWGAEAGVKYFVLSLGKILSTKNI